MIVNDMVSEKNSRWKRRVLSCSSCDISAKGNVGALRQRTRVAGGLGGKQV